MIPCINIKNRKRCLLQEERIVKKNAFLFHFSFCANEIMKSSYLFSFQRNQSESSKWWAFCRGNRRFQNIVAYIRLLNAELNIVTYQLIGLLIYGDVSEVQTDILTFTHCH